jgi:hypothetical protein
MVCSEKYFIYASLIASAWCVSDRGLAAQAVPSAYSDVAIRDAEVFLDKSRQDVITLRQTKRLLSIEYDSMVVEILRLKGKKEVGFFDRIELKGLMKDCEDISQQFAKMDKLLAAHRDAESSKIEELVGLMDDEIMFELMQYQKSRKTKEESSFSEEQLRAMLAEKLDYRNRLNDTLSLRLASVKTNRNDDDELLTQKADFLMDQQDKLLKYMNDLDRVMRRSRAENEIRVRSKMLFEQLDDMEVRPKELKHVLLLSHDSILSTEEFPSIIQKLKTEKQVAANYAKRLESEAKELYRSAEYKSKH